MELNTTSIDNGRPSYVSTPFKEATYNEGNDKSTGTSTREINSDQKKTALLSKLILAFKYGVYPVGMGLFVYFYVKIVGAAGYPADYEDLPGLGGLFLTFMIVSIALERVIPYNRQWNKYTWTDINDIFHIVSSIYAGIAAKYIMYVAAPQYFEAVNLQFDIWPHFLPFPLQVLFGFLIYDIAYYWYHRLAHKIPTFWRFHRLHHTSKKLTFTKGPRFHFLDLFFEGIMLYGVLLLLSMPTEALVWMLAFSFYNTTLQHHNIDVRMPRFFDWLFVTPGNHRIHHSSDILESNSNFGGSTMLWDVIFGTYKNGNDYKGTPLGVQGHKLSWHYLGHVFDFLKK